MPSSDSTAMYIQGVDLYTESLKLGPDYTDTRIEKIRELAIFLSPENFELDILGIRGLRGVTAQSLFAAAYSLLGDSLSRTKAHPPKAQELFDLAFDLAYASCRNLPNRRLLPYISYAIGAAKTDDARAIELRNIYAKCVLDLEGYTSTVTDAGLDAWPADVKWGV